MVGAGTAITLASQLGIAFYRQIVPIEYTRTDSISLDFSPDGEVYIEKDRFHPNGTPAEVTSARGSTASRLCCKPSRARRPSRRP